jgi:hypothetical protein
MPFVKIDTGILNSTIWFERGKRDVFITALLMAEPRELKEPTPQLSIDTLDPTGWEIPPGWYGFVDAAGPGIAARAMVPWDEAKDALRGLGEPEIESRSHDFEGRRLARVNGGYVVLNYMKYRERDYTSAERSARYRERMKEKMASRRDATTSRRDITQAEYRVQSTEAEEAKAEEHVPPVVPQRGTALVKGDDRFDRFWDAYPKKVGKGAARKAWAHRRPSDAQTSRMVAALERQRRSTQWLRDGGRYIPNPSTWLNQERWDDAPEPEVPQLSDKTIATMRAGAAFLRGDHD